MATEVSESDFNAWFLSTKKEEVRELIKRIADNEVSEEEFNAWVRAGKHRVQQEQELKKSKEVKRN